MQEEVCAVVAVAQFEGCRLNQGVLAMDVVVVLVGAVEAGVLSCFALRQVIANLST